MPVILRFCLVISPRLERHQIQRILGDEWYVIRPEDSICGYRFEKIIVDSDASRWVKSQDNINHTDWMNSLSTRLENPESRIVIL